MICFIVKLLIFIAAYIVPSGMAFHGMKNKRYDMVEYYLKYIYFFIIFEHLITPTFGRFISGINCFIWGIIHLSLYVVLIIPKFNYLNNIYEKVAKINGDNNISFYFNNYVISPLNMKANAIIKKLKTL
ncbi:hypothetical protein YYC_04625 [Plasmodium yoelii 17X]|uniref:Uncharacterized protein n=2 Tax=Plasmodium yoelii TaxID=5861 RepID=A0A077Y505_PLAYE|nr:conserved protein, unknown function [Plasmodium yoelii]ETB57814.1 hypothetical protein YYC_04625 [Plasmodium yoelii 17X]CDU18099.1 conserved Plasmodium protein, unknown function [Plasmodium yoelii]VTZ78516.1 conserved protein, unknown function [Plasmodium yoelii]|eukprot:XP_726915.2 conserved protein, unknown function [Plasmodium yoelii]